MKDRADFARKGIARGRSVVVLSYDDGIALRRREPVAPLHKISEIYDRIAFAAVGKYNEFENLRVAGVRYADLRGYSYDRDDVTARGPGQRLRPDPRQRLHHGAEAVRGGAGRRRGRATRRPPTRSTGSATTGRSRTIDGFVAMGGQADADPDGARGALARGAEPVRGLVLAVELLGRDAAGGQRRDSAPAQLEVAVLDRQRPRRAFRRLAGTLLERLLAPTTRPATSRTPTTPGRAARHADRQGDEASAGTTSDVRAAP